MTRSAALLLVLSASVCAFAPSLSGDVTRDGVTVFSADSGIVPPAGDFTALITFRHRGYAPVPKEMSWRNGMVMSCRSGYYDGWRVHLHDALETRPVFEIGRAGGSVAIDGGVTVSRGAWHRLAVSWGRSSADAATGVMRMWLDGILLAESPVDRPAPLLDGSTLKLGYADYGVGALYLETEDVRCLPKVLDADEIARDFRGSSAARALDARLERPLLMQVYDRSLALLRAERSAAAAKAPRKRGKVIELDAGSVRVNATRRFEGPEWDGLVIRGKGGKSVLHGYEDLPVSAFRPLADPVLKSRFPAAVRERVVAAEAKDADAVVSFGVGVARRAGILLVPAAGTKDAAPYPLARGPDAGCVPASQKDGVIRFLDPRPLPPPGTRFLAYGYWKYLWADAALPAEVTADGGFRLLEAHGYGLSDAPVAAVLGVPEVTDSDGEWCVVGDLLCIVPPPDFAGVRLPRLKGPFFEFRDVKDVRIENVAFEGCRDSAVTASRCEGIELAGVSFRAVGGNALTLDGCDRARVCRCSFADVGHTSLRISGGDRKTLFRGDMRVEECAFARNGRLQRTYTPSILLEGCGGVVAGCTFRDMPSSAIRIEGNDHVVRDNVFERTVLESDDQGAIDIWGDPTYRGNVFFRNRFSAVGGDGNNGCGRAAIRFDDMISGMAVISNEFDACSQGHFGAIQMNGGTYNAVVGNVFRQMPRGVTVGRWDPARWPKTLAEPGVEARLRVAEGNAAYRLRYPELDRLGKDDGVELILDNVFDRVNRPVSGLSGEGLFK